jgi:hypothetical protein
MLRLFEIFRFLLVGGGVEDVHRTFGNVHAYDGATGGPPPH